jgi:hypothetical protein
MHHPRSFAWLQAGKSMSSLLFPLQYFAVCTFFLFAFHALQTTADIGNDFMLYGGYLPWADTNNIVILFPQAEANTLNPKGCWDWYVSASIVRMGL